MNQALKYALAATFVAAGVALVAAAQTPPPNAVPAATPVTSPERFEPTDKVRADFDVSFPIDI